MEDRILKFCVHSSFAKYLEYLKKNFLQPKVNCFQRCWDWMYNREYLPSALYWVSFIYNVLLCRFFNNTLCSNCHGPNTGRENPTLIPEWLSDLSDAVRCLPCTVLHYMTSIYYSVLQSMSFIFCLEATSSVCTTFTVLVLGSCLFCFGTPILNLCEEAEL